jgi:hypothetical protein
MMTKRILLSLIAVTTAVFSLAAAASQQYLLSTIVLGVGMTWFTLENRQKQVVVTLFFLFFVGLALAGSLNSLSVLVMLFGLSTDLAAWDLSRFRARAGKSEVEPKLETRHLKRLFPTLGIGFLIALPPMFIAIPANFVVFFFLTLLVVIVLRASTLNLHQERESIQE